MEADWEVEVGGGAPVIEAYWPGFVDLRCSSQSLPHAILNPHPDRITEIVEAATFPPLSALLRALNTPTSPVWTSKCDLWEPLPFEFTDPATIAADAQAGLACYLDLLPLECLVFPGLAQAETLCREWVARLSPIDVPQCRIDLVIRQAVAADVEGFGITAYLGAAGADRSAAANGLATAMAAFAAAIPATAPPAIDPRKLQ